MTEITTPVVMELKLHHNCNSVGWEEHGRNLDVKTR